MTSGSASAGSFAIHGVPEAARMFFGKDVQNVTLSEAATIAGVIQSPPRLSPFNNPERAKERRNVVLRAMVDAGFIASDAADRATARTAGDGRARARRGSAVLRGLHQPGAGGQVPGGRDRRGRRVHDARPAHAENRAGRPPRGAGSHRRDPRAAQTPARAGRAHRGRPAHRRGPRVRRRPQLQPVAIQPGDRRQAPAGIGLQAVRLPRRVRARVRGKPLGRDARDPGDGRAHVLRVQPADVEPGQLRRRIRRRHHAAAGARAVAQHRHDQGRGSGRLRGSRPRSGARSAPARRRGRTRRSRSASSRRPRSRSPAPTPFFPTAAR